MSQPPAELTLTVADVDRLIASQHPHLRGHLRRVSHGWDNDVFRLGDGLAVRLPRRAAAAALVEHEQRWLPELAALLPVALPVPIAEGTPDAGYPWRWSIVPWFGGVPALELSGVQRDAYAEELGAVLRALHVPAPPGAPVNPFRGVALATRDAVVQERLARHPDLLAVWDDARDAPAWDGPAVWVHGDVHPGNVVVDVGRLTALIDFGDLTAGDPACDLAAAWTAFTPQGRAAFIGGFTHDEATWRRARGWAAWFAGLLWDDDSPGLQAMARHTADQLLRG